jgi:hypothetical protein
MQFKREGGWEKRRDTPPVLLLPAVLRAVAAAVYRVRFATQPILSIFIISVIDGSDNRLRTPSARYSFILDSAADNRRVAVYIKFLFLLRSQPEIRLVTKQNCISAACCIGFDLLPSVM